MSGNTFLVINAIYLLFSFPLMILIFLVSKFLFKIKEWYISDIFFVLFPGFFYWLLYLANRTCKLNRGKTIANIIAEVGWFIGLGCVSIFLIKVILNKFFPNYSKVFSVLSLAIIFVLIFLVYIFTPSIPE